MCLKVEQEKCSALQEAAHYSLNRFQSGYRGRAQYFSLP